MAMMGEVVIYVYTPPKTNECPLFLGTISVGNASTPTIDFQGIRGVYVNI